MGVGSKNENTGVSISYTFEDLRFMFCTGRAVLVSGTGRDKKYTYRTGVMTKIGDLEISEWKRKLLDLIEESGELDILDKLTRWAAENCAWLHSKQEVEQYALELHSTRIFENPDWVCLEEFKNYK